jgi:hypothetical protein
MGGFGSGAYGYMGSKVRKLTVEECCRIDVRNLQREGMLDLNQSSMHTWSNGYSAKMSSFDDYAILSYRYIKDGIPTDVKERIAISTSQVNYGGEGRKWFHCPNCSRRVALLYLRWSRFECRHCCNLTYMSVQERKVFVYEQWRRANRVMKKLGSKLDAPIDMLTATPKKPKLMRQRTYKRLMNEYRQHVDIYSKRLVGVTKRFGSF